MCMEIPVWQAYGFYLTVYFESKSDRVLIYVIFTAVIVLKYRGILSLDCIQHDKANVSTQDRWQSKMLLTIEEHGSKITRNSVLDCHLSQVGQQMAIKNSVSNYF